MNATNSNTLETIHGALRNIRSVPTKTGTPMVRCAIGEKTCKLFGEGALEMLANEETWEGQESEAQGRWDLSRGKEFIVKSFKKQESEVGSPIRSVADGQDHLPKPTLKVYADYAVITLPQGMAPERRKKVTDAVEQAISRTEAYLGGETPASSTVAMSTAGPTEGEKDDVPF